MRPQCGNLVITDSEMTLSLRCMFLPLPKKVTFWEIPTCMFLQQIVGLRCHFVFSLRFWHLFDVFQNLLISFKVHASDMASSVGLEQGCSSYALSNSVLSSLPRIGQGTGYRVLVAFMLCLEAQLFEKAPARAAVAHWPHRVKWIELGWNWSGFPKFWQVRSSKFEVLYLGWPNYICQIRFQSTSFPASSPSQWPVRNWRLGRASARCWWRPSKMGRSCSSARPSSRGCPNSWKSAGRGWGPQHCVDGGR